MEKKIYRSKISWWIVIFIGAVLVFTTIPAALDGVWSAAVVTSVVGLFIAHVFINTYYAIEGQRLKVVSSVILKYDIDVATITGITETNDPMSAPALSMDRLRINYGAQNCVVISPKEKAAFIQHLLTINPAITVKYKHR